MPVFILLCLCLSYLVETNHFIVNFLISPIILYVGLAFAIISILLIVLRKIPERICFDVFASSTLLSWFSAWKPNFNDQSPIFFFFPLYFALAAAFVTFILIGQRQNIDRLTLDYMQAFVEKSGMEPWLVMGLVLCSLVVPQHFMLFPVFMTLMLIRFALSGCLQKS
jgi:hypothetical protein